MQERVIKGIVLKAIDWGEKDKILNVFSFEMGKISIALKGVRQQKSKMKFASMPLSFVEFTIAGNGDIYTCIGASEIESFFEITADYDKIVYASAMLEMVDTITNTEEENGVLFLTLVKALSAMCNNELNSLMILAKFYLFVFLNMGYDINPEFCKICGSKFDNGARLDLNSGQINCLLCGESGNSILLSQQMLSYLKLIKQFDFKDLVKIKIKDDILNDLVSILNTNFTYRFNKKLKSIKF